MPKINRNLFQSSPFPGCPGIKPHGLIQSEEMEGLHFSINEILGSYQPPIKNNPVALSIQKLNSLPLHLPDLSFIFSTV